MRLEISTPGHHVCTVDGALQCSLFAVDVPDTFRPKLSSVIIVRMIFSDHQPISVVPPLTDIICLIGIVESSTMLIPKIGGILRCDWSSSTSSWPIKNVNFTKVV